MSLDDLITLLLVVLFVVVPLAQRFLRPGPGSEWPGDSERPREQPSRGDEPGETRPGRRGSPRSPRDADAGAGAERTGRPAQTQKADASDGATELERRIEEARRRVQQARQDQGAGPAPRPVAPSAPSRPEPDPGTLVRRRETQPTEFLGREGVSRPRTKKTAPLEVSKRSRGARGSTLSRGRVVSLRPEDIVRGIVWHQILSEPVSKRTRRRQSSRDP